MIGQQIQNYVIISQLGQGGMGTVYKAVDNVLGREVALKMLNTMMINQPQVLERFKKEAQVLARLLHPNIAVIYNLIEQNQQHFMVMEYVEGKNLDEVLRRNRTLPYQMVALIFVQALEGLHHAHKKGIFHRDIKPSNLILTPDGTVKLMDFGIAKVAGEQRMTQVNRVIGTVEFLAPEIIEGKEPSVASDIYAAGVTMYELLAGKLPFESNTDYSLMQEILKKKPVSPDKINGSVPRSLSNIVMKALEKKPENRFVDAGAFHDALLAAFPELRNMNLATLGRQLENASVPPPTQVISQEQWKNAPATSLQETRLESVTKPNNLVQTVTQKYLPDNRSRIIAGVILLLLLLLAGYGLFSGKHNDDGSADNNGKNKKDSVYKNPTGDNVAVTPVSGKDNHDPVRNDPPVVDQTPVTPKEDPVKKEQDRKEKERKDQERRDQEKRDQDRRDEEKRKEQERIDQDKKEQERKEQERRQAKTITIRTFARVKIRPAGNISSINDVSEGQSLRFIVTEPVVYEGETIIRSGATVNATVKGIGSVLVEFTINSVESATGKKIYVDRVSVRQQKKKFPERESDFMLRRGTVVNL